MNDGLEEYVMLIRFRAYNNEEARALAEDQADSLNYMYPGTAEVKFVRMPTMLDKMLYE
jgi:hypothetical protein